MDIFEKSRASELFTSVIALSLLCAIAAPGQVASKTWTQRTPDGQPDLEGYWSNVTITPLERPAELAGKEFYTQQELADQEKKKRRYPEVPRKSPGRSRTTISISTGWTGRRLSMDSTCGLR